MNKPDYLFLTGVANLEILEINQLLTANGIAESINMASHLLTWIPKLTDFQNQLNNAPVIADREFLQINHAAPGANTNSNNLNLSMYPPCIPGCGLNKTNFNKQFKFNNYEKFNERYCTR